MHQRKRLRNKKKFRIEDEILLRSDSGRKFLNVKKCFNILKRKNMFRKEMKSKKIDFIILNSEADGFKNCATIIWRGNCTD